VKLYVARYLLILMFLQNGQILFAVTFVPEILSLILLPKCNSITEL